MEGFTHLDDSARHLTCLSLAYCEIQCSQNCVFTASLIELHLHRAQLMRFHDQGVAACFNLTTLSCDAGFVGATDAAYTLNLQAQSCILPANLSLLTALTSLDLRAENYEWEGGKVVQKVKLSLVGWPSLQLCAKLHFMIFLTKLWCSPSASVLCAA